MKVGERRTCQVCGTQVSADRDVCPVCVLRAAITEEVSLEESASELPVVGSISEPARRRFENYELIWMQTADQSSWVGVLWASLTKPSTSIYGAP